MNSSFVAITILIKSDIGEKCLLNTLMNMLSEALRGYLKHANIYKGSSLKKNTDLIEMIVYGCITDKLSKNIIENISIKQANQITSKHKIKVESIPGYGDS